jgi:hypothetical protein
MRAILAVAGRIGSKLFRFAITQNRKDLRNCRGFSGMIPGFNAVSTRQHMGTLPPVILTPRIEERFWKFVNVVNDDDSCWEWTGFIGQFPYPKMRYFVNGKSRVYGAHRIGFLIQHGYWPNHFVCHHCDNPKCVRGSHLFDGTQKDNMRDMARKGRCNTVPRGIALIPSEDRPQAKMTPSTVVSIRSAYAAGGVTMTDLAKEHQVAISLIHGIIHRTRWRNVA